MIIWLTMAPLLVLRKRFNSKDGHSFLICLNFLSHSVLSLGKIGPMVLVEKTKLREVYDNNNDNETNDRFRSEKFTWAFGPGKLQQAVRHNVKLPSWHAASPSQWHSSRFLVCCKDSVEDPPGSCSCENLRMNPYNAWLHLYHSVSFITLDRWACFK